LILTLAKHYKKRFFLSFEIIHLKNHFVLM
jgi:hypothetical protein